MGRIKRLQKNVLIYIIKRCRSVTGINLKKSIVFASILCFGFSVFAQEKENLRLQIKAADVDKRNEDYCKYLITYIDRYGPDSVVCGFDFRNAQYNFAGWKIFKRSNDLHYLKKAIEWIKPLLTDTSFMRGPYLDTYANLLYKTGERTIGTEYEQKAIEITSFKHFYATYRNDMERSLERMKRNEPTW